MGVAFESLTSALKEMNELEEFAIQNLAEVRRFDFKLFSEKDRREIYRLLEALREDSNEHEKLIQEIINRLEHDKRESITKTSRDPLGISGHLRS